MQLSMFFFSMLFTLLFFFSTNPFSLGLILICQTITLSLLLGSMIKSFWFLYLLMLIFIGGMLVLFIYVTTIFPNEKFIFNQTNLLFIIFFIVMMISLIFLLKHFLNINLSFNSLMLNFNLMNENFELKYTVKMFLSQSNLLIILMVNYLFYCMIVVIKIVNFFKGPLRMMN